MTLTRDDYTVAWICALPLEMAAAKAMLDEIHSPILQPESDHNVYTLGRIHDHNVVVACLPAGVYGTVSAAVVVSHLVSTFTKLRFGLMVGIGGGAPRDTADIRLGDVVVSMPTDTWGGVIQYDYGKTLRDGRFQRTGSLNKPPQLLLKAVSQIRSEAMAGRNAVDDIVTNALQVEETKELFSRPSTDWLFESTYKHMDTESDCSKCDQTHLLHRFERTTESPYVHYGLIASGDQVMKDATTRDSIARDLNILCFEMEAAGFMDELPSIAIRGICDYSDSHKRKEWQGYAAISAAAYAKSILRIVPPISVNTNPTRHTTFTPEENECLQTLFLTDPADDRSALKRKKGNPARGTCEWILETDELKDWLRNDKDEAEVLWLYGNPGTGKSTMAIKITEDLENQPCFANGQKILAYFFCDSSQEKQRTSIAILRGLLYQLLKQRPSLMKHILPRYQVQKETLRTSFDALWAVLMEVSKDTTSKIYCVIDALDECERDSQESLLHQIEDSYRRGNSKTSPGLNFLITSRPYPEIREYLVSFSHKDLSLYSAMKRDLDAMIEEKVNELTERKKYPGKVAQDVSRILEEKAEGTFLWVGIACGELLKIPSRNAVKALEKLPRGLYALYQQLLDSALGADDEVKEIIMEMLKFVAFARRPLTIPELSALCQLYSNEDENYHLQFVLDLIGMCRLIIIIQDQRVQLLHKSVKDFLLRERDEINDLKAHSDLANNCIDIMTRSEAEMLPIVFLTYAVDFWPEHAALAKGEFSVRSQNESFFELQSIEWLQWLLRYNSLRQYEFDVLGSGFSVLHAAARWGISPLASWCLSRIGTLQESGDVATEVSYYLNFANGRLLTPLEEATLRGHTAVMRVFLEADTGVNLSPRTVTAAAGSEDNGVEAMALLLDKRGEEIEITEHVIEAAVQNTRNGKEILTMFLEREGPEKAYFANKIFKVVAKWSESGTEVMELIVDLLEDNIIQVTESVLKAAAENPGNGKQLLELLLDCQKDKKVSITEAVVKAAADNAGCGDNLIELLLDERGDEIEITKDVIQIAAANEGCGHCILDLLFVRRRDEILLTKELLQTAAANEGCADEIIRLLLAEWGDGIPDLEGVVETIAGNVTCGETMTLMLDKWGHEFQVTESVVIAAVENIDYAHEILKTLFEKRGNEIQITNDMVLAAAKNWGNGHQSMAVLIDQRGDEIQITEDVVMAAAERYSHGDEVIELLLDERGDDILITENVIKHAARSYDHEVKVLNLLFDRRGEEIKLTEDVVKTAVGNLRCGYRVLTVLFDRRGEEIKITEDVLKMAVSNVGCGMQVIDVLLTRRPEAVCANLTDSVLLSAASCGREDILRFLCGNFALPVPRGLLSIAQLYNASKNGDIRAVGKYLGRQTPPDIANIRGQTPLWIAAFYGHTEVVRMLLQTNKVNIDAEDVGGTSPIHWAADDGDPEMVVLLLQAGANPNVVDIDGDSPYNIAQRKGYMATATLLKDAMDSASNQSPQDIAKPPRERARYNYFEMKYSYY